MQARPSKFDTKTDRNLPRLFGLRKTHTCVLMTRRMTCATNGLDSIDHPLTRCLATALLCQAPQRTTHPLLVTSNSPRTLPPLRYLQRQIVCSRRLQCRPIEVSGRPRTKLATLHWKSRSIYPHPRMTTAQRQAQNLKRAGHGHCAQPRLIPRRLIRLAKWCFRVPLQTGP